MGFLGKRRAERELGPDRFVIRATLEQLIEATQKAAERIESSDAFSKKIRWVPEVLWTDDPGDGRAVVHYHRYNTKKERIMLTTFTVQVEWTAIAGRDQQAVTISTIEAMMTNDRVTAEPRHEELRSALLYYMEEIDPSVQAVELRRG